MSNEWFHLDGGKAYRVWKLGRVRVGYYSTFWFPGYVVRSGFTIWFAR